MNIIKMFNWIKIFDQGGKGPMDNVSSFIIQYVSGTANGSSCEEETFTDMR